MEREPLRVAQEEVDKDILKDAVSEGFLSAGSTIEDLTDDVRAEMAAKGKLHRYTAEGSVSARERLRQWGKSKTRVRRAGRMFH